MDLFKPSEKVCKMISSSGEKIRRTYEAYPFGDPREMLEFTGLYVVGLLEKLREFYLIGDGENRERLNVNEISHVVNELFKNWADHSPEGSNLYTGLFLGDLGVCYGFQDEGDFFKNPEIKNKLENKILIEDFNKNSREECNHNEGFNEYVFPYTELIEVDSEKGIFYGVQLRENIIAPEGTKNGSSYFYNLREKKGLG